MFQILIFLFFSYEDRVIREEVDFYGIHNLERFLQKNIAEAEYFNQAFAYWVLCALGRCKENINKYGILTRKLIKFSKKLWDHLRSLARKVAIKIRNYQDVH